MTLLPNNMLEPSNDARYRGTVVMAGRSPRSLDGKRINER